MPGVGIVDYGVGNLRSVQKGLEKVGVASELCEDAGRLTGYDGLVLPGVGAFGDAMAHLKARGMDRALREYAESGRHLLGICLGLQMLFDYSEEHGRNEGLGLIPGRVVRLPDTVKVPHMGWNRLRVEQEAPLFAGIENGSRFYFVHSYYCDGCSAEWVLGTASYGLEFTCAVGKGTVWGLQFHPEKSSMLGLRILENFGRMVGESS